MIAVTILREGPLLSLNYQGLNIESYIRVNQEYPLYILGVSIPYWLPNLKERYPGVPITFIDITGRTIPSVILSLPAEPILLFSTEVLHLRKYLPRAPLSIPYVLLRGEGTSILDLSLIQGPPESVAKLFDKEITSLTEITPPYGILNGFYIVKLPPELNSYGFRTLIPEFFGNTQVNLVILPESLTPQEKLGVICASSLLFGWGLDNFIKRELSFTEASRQIRNKLVDKPLANPLTVLVISRNQNKFISPMVSAIRQSIPGASILYILDRCEDSSSSTLESLKVPFIVKTEGEAFDAVGSRNMGIKHITKGDVLLLDGDRIPFGLTHALVNQALSSYDLCLLKVIQGERRHWFSDSFMSNPDFSSEKDNGVYTCGILLSRRAISSLQKETPGGGINHPIFSGRYGEEDTFMGYLANSLGLTCGGFPSSVYVEGNLGDSLRSTVDINISRIKKEILINRIKAAKRVLPEVAPLKAFTRLLENNKGLNGREEKKPIQIFFHVAQIGNWRSIVQEQLSRLACSSLSKSMLYLNIRVLGNTPLDLSALSLPPEKIRIKYEGKDLNKYEYPTLHALWEECLTFEGNVLYFHTKGVSSEEKYNKEAVQSWRKYMEYYCIDLWEEAVFLLNNSDALGPSLSFDGRDAFFGGNFWWATSRHIRKLPNPVHLINNYQGVVDRYIAEKWVCSIKGRFTNLRNLPSVDAYMVPTHEKDYRYYYLELGKDML
jgi:hypothetical protein